MSSMSPIEAATAADALEAVDQGSDTVNMRDCKSEFWGADELSKRLESTQHHVEWIFHNTKMEKHMNYEDNTETVNLIKDGGEREGWDAYMYSKLGNVNGIKVGQKVDGCHIKFGLTSNIEDTSAFENGFFLGIYPDKKVVRGERGKREMTCGKYDLNEQLLARISRGSVVALKNDETDPFDVIGGCEEKGTSMHAVVWIHEKDALGQLEHVYAIAMVTSIDMNGNRLTDDGVDRLCQALEVPWTKVVHLDLGLNRIRDVGAGRIAQVLEKPFSQITSLVLSNNEIGDDGAAKLAEFLAKEGCKVTKLWLSDNQIGDDGAFAIADMLEKETCMLTHIELAWNKIEDEGAERVIQGLSKPACKVIYFTLDHNKFIEKKTKKMLTAIMSKVERFVDMT